MVSPIINPSSIIDIPARPIIVEPIVPLQS